MNKRGGGIAARWDTILTCYFDFPCNFLNCQASQVDQFLVIPLLTAATHRLHAAVHCDVQEKPGQPLIFTWENAVPSIFMLKVCTCFGINRHLRTASFAKVFAKMQCWAFRMKALWYTSTIHWQTVHGHFFFLLINQWLGSDDKVWIFSRNTVNCWYAIISSH